MKINNLFRKHKYNAKRTVVDGITFDSKAEAKRYSELKIMERAGLISNLKLQPRYQLIPPYANGKGKKIRAIDYVADFEYLDKNTNQTIIEDVKGQKTQVYNIKKKIFEKRYKPLTITEIS